MAIETEQQSEEEKRITYKQLILNICGKLNVLKAGHYEIETEQNNYGLDVIKRKTTLHSNKAMRVEVIIKDGPKVSGKLILTFCNVMIEHPINGRVGLVKDETNFFMAGKKFCQQKMAEILYINLINC